METTTDIRPAETRPVPRSTAQENHFAGVGGVDISYRVWRPDEAPHAVLVIAPGFNSHSGQYEWVGQQFASRKVAVYAIDHRGRGRSDGKRFFVKDVLEYVEDLSSLIDIARARNPGRRVFLLGHSAGGVISCIYALEHPVDIDGLICESFAFKLPVPDFALSLVKGLSHIAPGARVLELDNKLFSRDPAVVESMNADPLINSSADKTLKLYDGHVHDLLNDVDKELVLGDIESWIAARTLS